MPGPDAEVPAARGRPTGRFVRRAVGFIALGLLTTCAVSACSSVLVRVTMGDRRPDVPTRYMCGWDVEQYQKPSVVVLLGAWRNVLPAGATDDSASASTPLGRAFADPPAFPIRDQWRAAYAHGWPMPAFGYVADRANFNARRFVSGAVSWGATAAGDTIFFRDADPHAIGFQPMWTGVLVDTVVFALGWLMLFGMAGWMRRRVTRLTLRSTVMLSTISLLLGVATSVFVALVCAVMIDFVATLPGGESEYLIAEDRRTRLLTRTIDAGAVKWQAQYNPRLTGGLQNWAESRRPYARLLEPKWTDYLDMRTLAYECRFIEARGWPFPCLWGGFEVQVPRDGSPVDFIMHRAVLWERESDPRADTPRTIIPLAPIWSGLAMNTAVYALTWFALLLLMLGPMRLLRAHRLARGRCPRCGYLLRGVAMCPECGTDVEAAKLLKSAAR